MAAISLAGTTWSSTVKIEQETFPWGTYAFKEESGTFTKPDASTSPFLWMWSENFLLIADNFTEPTQRAILVLKDGKLAGEIFFEEDSGHQVLRITLTQQD